MDRLSRHSLVPDHAVRIVTVKATPDRSGGKTGGGSTGPNCDGFLRIATNRLDLPAELIGQIYRLRWMPEGVAARLCAAGATLADLAFRSRC